jgi:hypothetical protein
MRNQGTTPQLHHRHYRASLISIVFNTGVFEVAYLRMTAARCGHTAGRRGLVTAPFACKESAQALDAGPVRMATDPGG